MNTNKVSVLIVTYNHENYIEGTIESVLNQTYQNFELIIVDDASTDNTSSLIMKGYLHHPKITYIRNPVNYGVTKTYNAALRASTGDLIAFLDGDDLFYPNKLEKQVKLFEEDPDLALSGHDVDYIDREGMTFSKYSNHFHLPLNGEGVDYCIKNYAMYQGSSLMVRSKFSPNYGFNESLKVISDGLFVIQCLDRNRKYKLCPGILGAYRRHLTNVTNGMKFHEHEDFYIELGILEHNYPLYAKTFRKRKAKYFYNYSKYLSDQHLKKESKCLLYEALYLDPKVTVKKEIKNKLRPLVRKIKSLSTKLKD